MVDWARLFLDFYQEVAAVEAPEGTQIDDVLAKFQDTFNLAQETVL